MNNYLLEEEVEIIEAFNHELTMYGHAGFCSFNEDVDSGYFIYKEDNIWVVNRNEIMNGIKNNVYFKKYTNIYDLCLDILKEMKMDTFYFEKRDLRMPYGTRVIITQSTDCLIDEIREGVINGSEVRRGEHGQVERIYQVMGDDGRVYTGLYGLKIYGDICFRTMESYLRDVESQIKENSDLIKELGETNENLLLIEEEMEGIKDRYLGEKYLEK